MIGFHHKKCLCNIADCGKCLTLGCTDDSCNIHRIVTKWRYRKRLLGSLINKAENLRDNKVKSELASLLKDIKVCEEEVKRLSDVMGLSGSAEMR